MRKKQILKRILLLVPVQISLIVVFIVCFIQNIFLGYAKSGRTIANYAVNFDRFLFKPEKLDEKKK